MPIPFRQICADYLTELRALCGSVMATGELSLRPALDRFLNRAAEVFSRPVQFIGEGKKVAAGKPDFVVTRNDLPIGYVEAEAYGVDLNNLMGHAKEQNDRFRANLDNFLLTNHLEFRLYVGGERVNNAKLSAPPEKGKVSVEDDAATKLKTLLERFLQGQLPTMASPRDLATHLARRTRQMRNEVHDALTAHDAKGGDLLAWFEAFRKSLLHDLTAEQFADMYAQTVAYGLFAARCAAPVIASGQDAQATTGKGFSRESAAKLVPKTNPFLRNLFQHIGNVDLDERVVWIADDMAQLLAQSPIGEILADFGKRAGKEDPVVHFYETFLAAYDAQLREVRGVYYTPEPVVSYIVRSLDCLLKTRFHKPLGLADEKTLILDPTTGTGSFLFAVVNRVRETVSQTIGAGAWSGYVEKALLPRPFGFELLVAPYAVAHLKLGLLLLETGYSLTDVRGSDVRDSDVRGSEDALNQSRERERANRVGIYLTNTLEEAVRIAERLPGLAAISEETNAAADIKKERPILVVLGNPPYSGHSANRSRDEQGNLTFIGKLIEDYKWVDGKPLGEKNPKWLQDDYVKFIRFAQWRIERTGEGVIGFITNHGYLDNPTFRGMRQSLMGSFDEIYVLNLHGNAKKKERAPDGGKDENVFDIQQGVAILLCVKQPVAWASCPREDMGNMGETPMPPCRVFHADLYGLREDKYQHLAETDVSNTQWTELQPSSPFYLFVPQNTELRAEYEQGWKVTEIFPVNVLGFQTHRDHFAVDFDEEPLRQRITALSDTKMTDDEVRETFRVSDNRDWKIAQVRAKLRADANWEAALTQCLYRPFDVRFCYYSEAAMDYPRRELIRNMLGKANLALNVTRQTRAETWQHAVVSNTPTPAVFVEIKDGSNVFPLHLYPDASGLGFDTDRRPNLSPAFLKALAEKLNQSQTEPHGLLEGITPEDVFHYAYAVFHSPTYRTRYAEFLKIDFPRLPLTGDLDLFRDLAALGKRLVALHLLNFDAAPSPSRLGLFPVAGSNEVEKVRYEVLRCAQNDRAADCHSERSEESQSGRVYVNATQYFDNVPPEVWECRVGGYQVCDKWLKDRKGRRLTFNDIQHYQRIIIALKETIRLMGEIDERIPGFPMN